MYGVSPNNKQNLAQWYKDIKKQLTSKAHENFFKRLQEIITLANHKLSHYDRKLTLDHTERQAMWNGIANDINSWKGVEITACTKQKTNYKSYAITSRNWWNRNKAKVYGNHFFYPILFIYIKQAVENLSLTQEKKNYVFVDIFDEILHAKIQFPQTRAQPIIPHQSFIQPNKFKYSSIDLLKTNGIHWTGKNIDSTSAVSSNSSSSSSSRFSDDDSTSSNSTSSSNTMVQRQSYYIKDKDRSLKVNNSFMDSLEMLKHRLHVRLLSCNGGNGGIKLKLKMKTEPMLCNTPQCLPPSIACMKKQVNGLNMTSIAAQSLLSNGNLNNNHNPVVVSAPNFNFPPSILPQIQVGNIPNINYINMVNNTSGFNLKLPSPTLDIPSLINTIANNGASPSPTSGGDGLMNLLMPGGLNYGAIRGQSGSVSNQRFSPTMLPPGMLPFNLQNMPNSYCSIRTDPVTGQLTLSLHMPLN